MSERDAATTNTAGPGATVGIQAEEVHNSTVYQVLPDAPPHQKYALGVRFLEDGLPTQARKHIAEAIAHEYDNAEVRFHWMLAMLSKRSHRDLTPAERAQLEDQANVLHKYPDNEWKRALEAICELLDSQLGAQDDPALALEKLHALPSRQRDKIIRHLDLVLTGGVKDGLWAEARQAAEDARLSADRLDRVWAYFELDPIRPRARKPAEEATTFADRLRAVLWSCLFAVAVGHLGWLVVVHASPLPILAYLVALVAGYVGARNGLEWRYRTERLHAKDRDYFGHSQINRAPEGGFANRVDHSFTYYFTKYAPKGANRDAWLAETAGIRNTLRDEIVELYREERVKIGQVNWLIRYLARDVRDRWEAGTLLEYRERYRTRPSTKLWCFLSLAALIAATVKVIDAAAQEDLLAAVIATLVALLSGRFATMQWLQIASERRRFADEYREHDEQLELRHAEYLCWKNKLDSTRPSEGEMETWLTCDKTMILDVALRHYRLAWRDIIAHAFLQTPARYYKRARVSGGPWRYSKYDIRLFLITHDGVREVATELDFERGSRNGEERNNFRFDAVSSVHVASTGGSSYTLELTLMNGPTRNIRVIDLNMEASDPAEDTSEFIRINLDSAGFAHTLHILEGIAAEGKNWIDRTPHVIGNSRDLLTGVDWGSREQAL
ncbi:hypothetical protein GCM10011581_31770 [Saccharopolyspora subtropica]|uniref:Uncharacterized protein n=1 Tax=Saccharopolyspora thermophila TaxID=89367 RepID=A0A917NF96_9PSEU|nr:hypothetical protein [Saccharopolyspora subtropica]GGI92245.1 hypothetical protein GCM10011581_31770 [Saccharopolyspora subtropica]